MRQVRQVRRARAWQAQPAAVAPVVPVPVVLALRQEPLLVVPVPVARVPEPNRKPVPQTLIILSLCPIAVLCVSYILQNLDYKPKIFSFFNPVKYSTAILNVN